MSEIKGEKYSLRRALSHRVACEIETLSGSGRLSSSAASVTRTLSDLGIFFIYPLIMMLG